MHELHLQALGHPHFHRLGLFFHVRRVHRGPLRSKKTPWRTPRGAHHGLLEQLSKETAGLCRPARGCEEKRPGGREVASPGQSPASRRASGSFVVGRLMPPACISGRSTRPGCALWSIRGRPRRS
jgi:hypothetical protein